MSKIVCFGEIMGRLNPEGYLRLRQARKLEISYCSFSRSHELRFIVTDMFEKLKYNFGK